MRPALSLLRPDLALRKRALARCAEFRVAFDEQYTWFAGPDSTASTAPDNLKRELSPTTTLIATPTSFRHALAAADTAVHLYPTLRDLAPSLKRDAPWRHRPASDSLRSLALQTLANATQHADHDSNADVTSSSSSTHVFDGDGDDDEPWWAHVAFAEQFTEGDASDLVAASPHSGLAVLERQRRALVERDGGRARAAGGEERWDGDPT